MGWLDRLLRRQHKPVVPPSLTVIGSRFLNDGERCPTCGAWMTHRFCPTCREQDSMERDHGK